MGTQSPTSSLEEGDSSESMLKTILTDHGHPTGDNYWASPNHDLGHGRQDVLAESMQSTLKDSGSPK